MKTKFQATIHALITLTLLMAFRAVPAAAATTAITGGTYGASCGSGGYFTPSAVTINSGDTITFSVPPDDPYSGGMEIIGFPQGNFTVARGGSFTTNAITAGVSYHGTWPGNTSCLKGSGTVTVNAPVPPPSPPPSSGGSSSGSSSGGSTGTGSSSGSGSSSQTTVKSPASTATQPAVPATTPPAATTSPAAAGSGSKSQTKTKSTTTKSAGPAASAKTVGQPTFKDVTAIGGSSLAIVIAGLFVAWRLVIRRRTPVSGQGLLPATSPDQPVPPVTPPAQSSGAPADQSAAEPQDKQE